MTRGARPFDGIRVSGGIALTPTLSHLGRGGMGSRFRGSKGGNHKGCAYGEGEGDARPFDKLRMSGREAQGGR